MSHILRPSHHNVDWNNPLSQGLLFYAPMVRGGGDPQDIGPYRRTGSLTNLTSANFDTTRRYYNWDHAAAAAQGIDFGTWMTALLADRMSVMAVVMPESVPGASNGSMIFSNVSVSTTAYDWGLLFNDTGVFYFRLVNSGGTNVDTSDSDGAATLNVWYVIIATYDGATTKLYKNGVLKGTNSQTGNVRNTPYSLWTGRYGSTRSVNMRLGPLGAWSRALSHGEVALLSSNPLCLLEQEGNVDFDGWAYAPYVAMAAAMAGAASGSGVLEIPLSVAMAGLDASQGSLGFVGLDMAALISALSTGSGTLEIPMVATVTNASALTALLNVIVPRARFNVDALVGRVVSKTRPRTVTVTGDTIIINDLPTSRTLDGDILYIKRQP